MAAVPQSSDRATQPASVHSVEEARVRKWAASIGAEPVLSLADIKDGEVDPAFEPEWCRARKVLPLRDGTLLCADTQHVSEVKKLLRKRENFIMINIRPATMAVIEEKLVDLSKVNQNQQIGEIHASEVQNRITAIVSKAVDMGASDVHVEVRPNHTRVRFHIYGVLYEIERLTSALGHEIAQVLFNFMAGSGSGSSVYNPREPQDESTELTVGGRLVRIRLVSIPAHPTGSADLVLRLLVSSGSDVRLIDELGFTPEHVRIIRGALSRPHGMVLVAGPTGSGKSTTLASMVMLLSDHEKTYTIEDPVEFDLKDRTQIPANTDDEKRNFSAYARALMRAAPKNIMLGEIRDEETAQNTVRLAITGHRVLSTVHADSARNVVTRLVDFGISNAILADPDLLVALLYQRLVPVVCRKCSIGFEEEHAAFQETLPGLVKRLESALENTKNIRFRGEGCRHCNGTGAVGVTVVAEVIYLDRQGRSFIQAGNLPGWEAHLLDNGWQSMRAHLLSKIEQGLVSPYDAELIIGSLSESLINSSFDYRTELGFLGGEEGAL